MDLYKRIKLRREKLGITQEELAKMLNYKSRSSINKIENGENDIPQSRIIAFANALQTTPAYLMGWRDDPSVDQPFLFPSSPRDEDNNNAPSNTEDFFTPIFQGDMVSLPIVGSVSCGNGALAFEEIVGHEPTPKGWLNGGEYFYTRAKGDSMVNARIQDGDLVLIRKQPDVEDGEIAAVAIDDEIFLKRVYKRNGNVILQSENPKYPPIIADLKSHNCMIIGKLSRVIIKM